MLNITNMLDISYVISTLVVLVSMVVTSEITSGRRWLCPPSPSSVSLTISTTVVTVASLNMACGMTLWIRDNLTNAP